MCSHHIHQLESTALERVDKTTYIYIYVDLTRNYMNLQRGINPPYPNPVVTCKQSAAHMTYLMPADVFFSFPLVFQYVMVSHNSDAKSTGCGFTPVLPLLCCRAFSRSIGAGGDDASSSWKLIGFPCCSAARR